MTTDDQHAATDELPPELALAFRPLHKRALGTAVGVAAGLAMFAMTAVVVVRGPGPDVPDLTLLRAYFAGYEVSWRGAFVGLLWGFGVGYVAGWFTAFCRNFIIAASLFISRTRAELNETRDFLDHI